MGRHRWHSFRCMFRMSSAPARANLRRRNVTTGTQPGWRWIETLKHMILRFAPFRFLALFALLVSGLIFAPFASLHGQTTKDAQDQSGQTPYPGTPVEEIVARVNDQVISTSDYDKS